LKNAKAKFCARCGAKVERDREEADGENGYCSYCSSPLAEEIKLCVKCGAKVESQEEVKAEAKGKSCGFCENCGTELFGFDNPDDDSPLVGPGIGFFGVFSCGKRPIVQGYCPKCGTQVRETE